jgi:O-antigen/teichoic acid export membrane protein
VTQSGADPVVAVESASGRGRSVVALLDQVLSGLSNFLTLAVVARSTTTDGFGHFSLAYALLIALLTLVRALWGTRISLAGSAAGALTTARGLLGALVIAAPVIGVLVLLPTLLLTGGDGVGMVVIIAVAAPLVCAQDLCRFAAISGGRPGVAAAADLFWVVVVVGAYVVDPGPLAAVSVWLFGAVGGLLMAASALRLVPSFRDGARALRQWERTGVGIAVGNMSLQLGSYVVLGLATVAVSFTASGALRGASSVMAPVNTVLGFLTIGLLPVLHRRPPEGQQRFAAGVAAATALLAAAWTAVLLVLPTDIGRLLLGDTWETARPLLPWTGAEYLCLVIGAAALLGLQARQAGRLLLRLGLGMAGLLVAAAVLAAALGSSTVVFAIAQAAAALIGASVAWVAYRRVAARSSGTERIPAPGGRAELG